MKIPRRGSIYSCNESYVDGWDPKFREYLGDIKNGRGETGRRYTQRYIGSMVGDVSNSDVARRLPVVFYLGCLCRRLQPDAALPTPTRAPSSSVTVVLNIDI